MIARVIAHEMVHLVAQPNSCRFKYVDGSSHDYLRLRLASYRFGDVNECLFIARHTQAFQETFDHCIDTRFNDRTLVRTRRSYDYACRTGDPACLTALSHSSSACWNAMTGE